jgi:hypothetical protein
MFCRRFGSPVLPSMAKATTVFSPPSVIFRDPAPDAGKVGLVS